MRKQDSKVRSCYVFQDPSDGSFKVLRIDPENIFLKRFGDEYVQYVIDASTFKYEYKNKGYESTGYTNVGYVSLGELHKDTTKKNIIIKANERGLLDNFECNAKQVTYKNSSHYFTPRELGQSQTRQDVNHLQQTTTIELLENHHLSQSESFVEPKRCQLIRLFEVAINFAGSIFK